MSKYGFHTINNFYSLNKSKVEKNLGGIFGDHYNAARQFWKYKKRINKELEAILILSIKLLTLRT